MSKRAVKAHRRIMSVPFFVSTPGSAGILPALGPQASCLPEPSHYRSPRRFEQAGCLRPRCRQDACAPRGCALFLVYFQNDGLEILIA